MPRRLHGHNAALDCFYIQLQRRNGIKGTGMTSLWGRDTLGSIQHQCSPLFRQPERPRSGMSLHF